MGQEDGTNYEDDGTNDSGGGERNKRLQRQVWEGEGGEEESDERTIRTTGGGDGTNK